MEVLYVTFGSDHERSDPREWVRTDGYAAFEAPTFELVYGLIDMVLGRKYAFSYDDRPDRDEQGKRWYPRGETARIKMSITDG